MQRLQNDQELVVKLKRTTTTVVSFCIASRLLMGDVSYRETTQITGGSIVGMMKMASAFSRDAAKLNGPIVATVAVKGNRMVRSTPDFADITDLDAKTMTHVDRVKHQYSVMTFEQMREAAERAEDKAESRAEKRDAKDPNIQVTFDVHVKKTGATKQVAGLDTNELILTMAMNGKDNSTGQQGAMSVTNDMWMASDVPGYAEVQEFRMKMAKELQSDFTPSASYAALLHQAQSSDALKALAKEMSQVKGVPLLQIMRMGTTANGQPLPAASEAPLPASDSQASNQTMKAVLGSALGGFGRHKREQQEAAPSTEQAKAGPAILMESTTKLDGFTTSVDDALFQVPADYKQVTRKP